MTMYRIDGQGVSKDLAGSVSADEAVAELRRQLAAVTAERDLARRELSIADTHRKELSRTLDVANATIDRLRGAARC